MNYDHPVDNIKIQISQNEDYIHQLLSHLTCQSWDGRHTDLSIGGMHCHKLLLNIASVHLTRVRFTPDANANASPWGILQEIHKTYPYEMEICLKYIYGRQVTLSPDQRDQLRNFANAVFNPFHFDQFLGQFTDEKRTFGRFEPWLDLLKEILENYQVFDVESCTDMCFVIQGEQVRCHKCILSAMSPAYYDHQLLGIEDLVINLDDSYPYLTYYGVSEALKFMYGCELLVERKPERMFEILNAATYFKQDLLRFKLIMMFQIECRF